MRMLLWSVVLIAFAAMPILFACQGGAAGDARADATPSAAPPVSRPATTGPSPVAVVELFTSEGCSSCPPADVLLSKLSAETAKSGSGVYYLAFHVDYWDRLGWPDRFASADYTARQRAYAAAAGTRQVYTPQAVVNGAGKGFVGSDATAARAAIEAALAKAADGKIELSVESLGHAPSRLRVAYVIQGVPVAGMKLNVAVTESGLTTQVRRGENGGRLLHHDHVVRAFETVALTQSTGFVDIALPPDLNRENAELVAYSQSAQTLAVIGATASRLP